MKANNDKLISRNERRAVGAYITGVDLVKEKIHNDKKTNKDKLNNSNLFLLEWRTVVAMIASIDLIEQSMMGVQRA